MSVKAMAWALEQSTENPVDKLILIALGNYADDADQCFPSRRTLARIAMCSLDTVDRAIKRLEAAGMIRKEVRQGARGLTSNAYELCMDPSRNLRPPQEAKDGETLAADVRPPQPQIAATLAAPDAATLAARAAATYEPLLEPSIEPSKTPLPPKGGPSPMDALRAFESYNALALRIGIPQASKLTPERQRKIIARLRDYGLDGWDRALANIERSSFLTGANDRGWRTSLDWLLSPAKFAPVHDGSYGNGRHADTTPDKPRPMSDRDRRAAGANAVLKRMMAEAEGGSA